MRAILILRKQSWLIFTMLIMFVGSQSARAVVYFVRANGGNDVNNGTSWATAKQTLHAALVLAVNGDQVWVAAGTYKPTAYPLGCTNCNSNRDFSFLVNSGVSVFGGFNGNETQFSQRNVNLNQTVLSGDIGTINNVIDNSYTILMGLSSSANGFGITLDGLFIRDGRSDGLGTMEINGNFISRSSGAGIYLLGGTSVIRNCRIFNHSEGSGTALYCSGGYLEFTNNYVWGNQSIESTPGLRIIGITANSVIRNNVFANNSGRRGGAILISNSNIAIENNAFFQNSASQFGGGIYFSNSGLSLVNNIFQGNKKANDETVMSADFENDGSAGLNLIFLNNLLQRSVSSYVNNASSSNGIGLNPSGNLFGQNPLFTNSVDPDGPDNLWGTSDDGLQTTSSSPLVNSGSLTTSATNDIFGRVRVGNPDVGPYEFNNCTNLGGPITASLLGDTSICMGQSAILRASISGGVPPYNVSYGGAGLTYGYTSMSPISVSPINTTVYTLFGVVDANGCTATILGNPPMVNVNKVEPILAVAEQNAVCPGAPVNIRGEFLTAPAGQAISISGANTALTVPSNLVSNLFANTGFTVEGWVNPSQLNAWTRFFDFSNGQASNNILFTLSDGSNLPSTQNKPALVVWNGNIASNSIVSSQALTLNQWTHLAVTYSYFNNTATIYMNGVQVASGVTSQAVNTGITRNINYIGYSPWNEVTNARFDEIRMWNVALPASSILTWYNKPYAAQHPQAGHLLTRYSFEDHLESQGAPFSLSVNGGGASAYQAVSSNFGGTYSWSTGQTTQRAIVNPTTLTTYTVTYSKGSCNTTGSVTIGLLPANYQVSISASDTTVCVGTSVNLTASVTNRAPSGQAASIVIGNPTSASGYVSVPSSLSSALIRANAGFTAEGWFNVSSYNQWARFFDFSNGAGTNNVLMAISEFGSGKPTFGLLVNGVGQPGITSNTPIPLNNWFHLAVSYDMVTTIARIYLNGVQVASGSTGLAPTVQSRSQNFLGFSPWNEPFSGQMDEVRFWNTVLAPEVVANFRSMAFSSNHPNAGNLVARYTFEGNANSSIGTHHGSFVNGSSSIGGIAFPLTTLFSWNNPALNISPTQVINSTTDFITNYNLSGSNNGCSGSDTQRVTAINSLTPLVTITSNPSGTICEGTPITFTATPTNGGSSPEYMWRLNGMEINGVNGNTFTLPDTITQYWKSVASGQIFSVGVRSDGTLWSWGYNSQYGQLGNGTQGNIYLTPYQIGASSDWDRVYCGSFSVFAIKKNGSLWVWGRNDLGQLGLGHQNSIFAPVQLGSDTNWLSIEASSLSTFAIKSNGTLWSWGSNNSGQLGRGNFTSTNNPVQVGIQTNWKSISTSFSDSCGVIAVRNDGTLWAWGKNSFARLGIAPNNFNFTSPTQVGTATNWIKAETSDLYSYALKSDGTLWRVGVQGNGGTASNLDLTLFTQQGTDSNWTDFSVIAYTTFARKSNGQIWSWGYSGDGELGNGSVVNSQFSPVNTGLVVSNQARITGYYSPVFAHEPNGVLKGWGRGTFGQFANGTTANRVLTPTIINAPNAIFSSTNGSAVQAVLLANNVCQTSNSANSNVITIQATPSVAPSVSVSASANNVAAGTSVTFTASPTNGGSVPLYQWRKNRQNISGQTGLTFSGIAGLDFRNGDTISVVLTANNTCQTSATATSSNIIMQVILNRAFVDGAVANSGIGNSWSSPFKTLQEALTLVSNSGEIWVKAGTYKPTHDLFGNANPIDTRTRTFYVRSGIKLYGGFNGTESSLSQRNAVLNTTSLSGDIGVQGDSSDNCFAVLLSVTPINVNSGITLDGFTITKGFARGIDIVNISGMDVQLRSGAGVALYAGIHVISNCIFLENNAIIGGGISAQYAGSLLVSNCIFYRNYSLNNGGGIFRVGGHLRVENSLFANNSSQFSSAGISFIGSNVYNSTFINNTFADNLAANFPVALDIWSGNNLIQNNIFRNNLNSTGTFNSRLDFRVINSGIATFKNNVLQHDSIQYNSLNENIIAAGSSDNKYSTNPQFQNPNDPDGPDNRFFTVDDGYQLLLLSPAVDAGLATGAPLTDISGISRPQGAGFEIGAYELGCIPVTPAVSIARNTAPVCPGGSVTFTASPANGGTSPAYQWRKNGATVVGATSSTYTGTVGINFLSTDSLSVVMTSNNVCQSSNTAVSVSLAPWVFSLIPPVISPISDMSIAADSIILSATPVGGTFSGLGITGNLFRPWLLDTGLVTISYSSTDGNGCISSASTGFRILDAAIVWDGIQWKYGTPSSLEGTRDLMVLSGNSPIIPTGTACRDLVLRGGALTHNLNNLLILNRNLRLRGGSMNGGGTLRFTNAAAQINNSSNPLEFRADVEVPSGVNVSSIANFRLAPGSNIMAGTGTPNGGGTTSGTWTLVQKGSSQFALYNAWSSPIVGGTGRQMTGTNNFRFNAVTQTWELWDSSLVMTPGRGYIATAATNGWFRGALHNGDYFYPVVFNSGGSSWNLIGNPYPSQLNLSDFLNANTNVNGTAYFMKTNVNVNVAVTDYTAINGLTVTTDVPVSQGFFVEANASGNAAFTNSMRRAGRTAFYQRTQNNAELVWLKGEQPSAPEHHSTTLIGFKPDATNGFDRMYDGRLLKGNTHIIVSSQLNNEAMAIQGLPSLNGTTSVPLQVEVTTAGNFSLKLDSTTLDASNFSLYLEDTQSGTMHNLRASSYSITSTQAQVWTNRFRLWINPMLTSTQNPTQVQPLRLYAHESTLVIDQLAGTRVKEVRLTDLSGRVIENWQQPQGESRIELPTTAANGVYLMTVITTDGTVQTERVLVRY